MRQRGGGLRVRSRWNPRGWAGRAVLSVFVVLVVAVPGTQAAWVDPAPVTGTTISAGTADLRVDGSNAPAFTAMNVSTLEGGDSTAGVLTVSNAGDVPLSYHVDASATNADGKGLASQLVVKVTSNASTSGSSPSVTCAGTALAGTGTSFTAGLIGSASNRRSLGAGASETLCIQAGLPDGTAALGGTTSITLTFTAVTGSTANPGWSDTVTTSGTTLSMANAFYLGTNAAGNTSSTTLLPLRRSSPTLGTLFNYDTDRDSTAGLVVKNSGAPSGRLQQWSLAVGGSPLTLSGTATVRLWSAMRGFDTSAVGSLEVSLWDCDAGGGSCSQISTSTVTSSGSWSGGSSTWVRKTWTLGTGSYTFAAGRTIQVRVAPTSSAADDMLIAYDTTTYRTALLVTP